MTSPRFIEINPGTLSWSPGPFRRGLAGFLASPLVASLQARRGRATLSPVAPFRLRIHHPGPKQQPLVFDFDASHDILYPERPEDSGPAGAFKSRDVALLRGFCYDLLNHLPEASSILFDAWKATGHTQDPYDPEFSSDSHLVHFVGGGLFFTGPEDQGLPQIAMMPVPSNHAKVRAITRISAVLPWVLRDPFPTTR